MNPSESLESLWGSLQPPTPPPVENILRKARTFQRKERREMRMAGISLLTTVVFLLAQVYWLWPHPASMVIGIIAAFLGIATWRGSRYLKQLKVAPTLDTQTYLTQLRDQKDGAQALQRFIFRVYIPVLGCGIIAALWVILWDQPLWLPTLATLLTIAWIAFTAWWGKRRQARKYAQIDGLLRDLGNE